MNNQNPQQMLVQNIVQAVLKDPANYDNIRCASCGGTVFDRVTVIKVIPATHPQNPVGRPQNLNLETFVCRSCGNLLDERLSGDPGQNSALPVYGEANP